MDILTLRCSPSALAKAQRGESVHAVAVVAASSGPPFGPCAAVYLTSRTALALSRLLLSARKAHLYIEPSLTFLAHELARELSSLSEPSPVLSPSELCCDTDCGRSANEACRNV